MNILYVPRSSGKTEQILLAANNELKRGGSPLILVRRQRIVKEIKERILRTPYLNNNLANYVYRWSHTFDTFAGLKFSKVFIDDADIFIRDVLMERYGIREDVGLCTMTSDFAGRLKAS